jgi:hypothetical protein
VSWTNGQGTNLWGGATNWSNGTVPDGAFEVTIGAPAPTNLNVTASINSLDVLAAGILNIRTGQTLTLTGNGNLGNAGLISLDGGSTSARLQFMQDMTLSGAGSLVLGSTTSSPCEIAGSVNLTISPNQTVSGSGRLNIGITNNGSVVANAPGLFLVLLRPSTNFATMKATNSGSLAIVTNVNGGQIVADGGSVSLGAGGSLFLSTLSTANGGIFRTISSNAALDTVTNNGLFSITFGHTLEIRGPLTNNGEFSLAGMSGAPSTLSFRDATSFSGSGTISLESANSRLTGANQIIQANGHTIRGGGTINPAAFSNNGLVLADKSSVPLFINSVGNGTTGVLRAINGATMALTTNTNNQGTIEVGNGSTFSVATASSFNSGSVRLGFNGGTGTATFSGGLTATQGGTISGNGTINGNLANSGVIAPGLSAGRIDVNGNLSLTNTSNVTFEIGGTALGTSYDHMFVSSAITLGGQLAVTLINAFLPSSSDVFTIMDGSSLSGAFSNVPSGQRITTTDGSGSFLVTTGGISSTVELTNFQVPEPSAYPLLLTAGGGLLALRRRR